MISKTIGKMGFSRHFPGPLVPLVHGSLRFGFETGRAIGAQWPWSSGAKAVFLLSVFVCQIHEECNLIQGYSIDIWWNIMKYVLNLCFGMRWLSINFAMNHGDWWQLKVLCTFCMSPPWQTYRSDTVDGFVFSLWQSNMAMGNSPPKKLVLQSWQNHLKAESCQCHVWLQECMYLNIHRQWKFSSREPCSFVSFFYVLCLKNLSCAGCARKVQWSPVQRPSMCMQHTHSPGIYLFCTKILVEADVSSSLPCTACFSRLHKKAAEKFIKTLRKHLKT